MSLVSRRHTNTKGFEPCCPVTRVELSREKLTDVTKSVCPKRILGDCLPIESVPPPTPQTTTALSLAYATTPSLTAIELDETQEAPNRLCKVSAEGVFSFFMRVFFALVTAGLRLPDCLRVEVLSTASFIVSGTCSCRYIRDTPPVAAVTFAHSSVKFFDTPRANVSDCASRSAGFSWSVSRALRPLPYSSTTPASTQNTSTPGFFVSSISSGQLSSSYGLFVTKTLRMETRPPI